jgi:hypothetical protein
MAHDTRPILFIGDIQGCSTELADLLQAAGFDPARHLLLPLGDTINRGPDAAGVLRLLRENRAEPLQGNHERWLLAAGGRSKRPPRNKSGSAWYQLAAADLLEETLRWMRQWPLLREGPDWIAVHAGLHPTLPPRETPPDFLTEVRYCDGQGRRPADPDGTLASAPPGFQPWFDFYHGPRTVIFGHWARLGLIERERLYGLDTGCVYGNALTGLWWPERRLVQVPSRQPRVYDVTGPDRPRTAERPA